MASFDVFRGLGEIFADVMGENLEFELVDGRTISLRAIFNPLVTETAVGDAGVQVVDTYPAFDIPRELLRAETLTADDLFDATVTASDGLTYVLETPRDDGISLVRCRAHAL